MKRKVSIILACILLVWSVTIPTFAKTKEVKPTLSTSAVLLGVGDIKVVSSNVKCKWKVDFGSEYIKTSTTAKTIKIKGIADGSAVIHNSEGLSFMVVVSSMYNSTAVKYVDITYKQANGRVRIYVTNTAKKSIYTVTPLLNLQDEKGVLHYVGDQTVEKVMPGKSKSFVLSEKITGRIVYVQPYNYAMVQEYLN